MDICGGFNLFGVGYFTNLVIEKIYEKDRRVFIFGR